MSLVRHNPAEVAGLIYQSAPELFDLTFGSCAVPVLTEFVRRSHNRFSHQYIWVSEVDRCIVGMVVLVPATCLSDRADEQLLSVGRRLWLQLVRSLSTSG
jgi:hypothetical protein